MTKRDISELKKWEDNLQEGDEEGQNQTADIIELLGAELEPLAAMPDGTILDGNGRIDIYLSKGINPIPCIDVDVLQNSDGVWVVWIEGQFTKATFNSKEDGMQYVSMARNHKPRHLSEDKLREKKDKFGIDWGSFSNSLASPDNVDDILASINPTPIVQKPVKFKHDVVVSCADQEQAQELFTELRGQGFNVRIKSKAGNEKPVAKS